MKTTHRIINGDALKVLKTIPNNSVDLVFADPPYNMSKKKGLAWKYSKHVTMQESWDMFSKDEYFKFNKEWLAEGFRVLKHGEVYGFLEVFIIFTRRDSLYRNFSQILK